MSETVWISVALGHPSNMRPLKHSFSNVEQEKIGLDWSRRNLEGEPLSAEYFPSDIWGIKSARESNYKFPHLFAAGNVWVVSSAAAHVMRQFDLGGGGFFPVKVFKKDHVTPVGGDWFCINFGNKKSVIVPDQSMRMMHQYIRNGEKGWFPAFVTSDGDVALSPTALLGPDIWIDLDVGDAFFLSDRLAKALKKAKCDKGFFLSKCRVVEA